MKNRLAIVLLAALGATAMSHCASSRPAATAAAAAAPAAPCPCKGWIQKVEEPAPAGCIVLQVSPHHPGTGCEPYAWGYRPSPAGSVLGFRPLNPDATKVRACGNPGVYQVHVVSAACGCALYDVTVPK